MPPDIAELIARSERDYFAGQLKQAIALIDQSTQREDFGRFSAEGQAALRLQLGKLLVTAIFMEGADAAAARRQLDSVRNLGDPRQRAAATDQLGLSNYYEQLAREHPDFSLARSDFEIALAAREAWADPRELSESHFHVGMVAQFTGEPDSAGDRFRFAYELARQGGHKLEQSFAVRHIGFLQRARGEFEAAYASMAESLRLRQEIGLRIYLPFSLLTLADAALALTRHEEAAHNYSLAEEIAISIGNKRAQLLSALALGRLHRSREDWSSARMSFGKARSLAEEIGHQVAVGEASEALRSLPEGSP